MKNKYYLYEIKTGTLNIISILLLVIMIGLTIVFVDEININMVTSLVLLIPYLILHELLHSLSYVIHGAKFNRVTYGIHLEKGIMCCLCKQDITKKNILISLLYPFIFIGLITFILGIVYKSGMLIFLSICNISGCSADLVMFFDFLKLKDFKYAECDNPLYFGIKSSEDLSNKEMFGLRRIGTVDKLEQNDLKKFSISKVSMITIVIFIVIIIMYYLKKGCV